MPSELGFLRIKPGGYLMLIHRQTPYRPRVLFVLPPFLATPPEGYGGIEAVAAALIPELQALGMQMIVTTPTHSTVPADEKHELTEPLYQLISQPYEEASPSIENYVAAVARLAWESGADLIHDFTGRVNILNTLAAPLSHPGYPPVIHTIHLPFGQFGQVATYRELLWHRKLTYTGISEAQAAAAPLAVRKRTHVIHNCINAADYPLGPGGQRLLVMGRICHDKGQDRLAAECAATGMGLDIAGTVAQMGDVAKIQRELEAGNATPAAQKPDFRLFRRMQRHIDGKQIKFWGNAGGALKRRLLMQARALVMPNRWDEPFGMTAIEAMASGTPVIAMRSGALPEIVRHGVTGYLADSVEELRQYLRPEYTRRLDRAACQEHVIRNFGAPKIAGQYASLYRNAILQPQLAPLRPTRLASAPKLMRGMSG